jgi:hypothetical protein
MTTPLSGEQVMSVAHRSKLVRWWMAVGGMLFHRLPISPPTTSGWRGVVSHGVFSRRTYDGRSGFNNEFVHSSGNTWLWSDNVNVHMLVPLLKVVARKLGYRPTVGLVIINLVLCCKWMLGSVRITKTPSYLNKWRHAMCARVLEKINLLEILEAWGVRFAFYICMVG